MTVDISEEKALAADVAVTNGTQGTTASSPPTCPQCGAGPFKDDRGLRTHVSQIHDGAAKRRVANLRKRKTIAKREKKALSRLGHPTILGYKFKTAKCPVPGCGKKMAENRIPRHVKTKHPDFETVAEEEPIRTARAQERTERAAPGQRSGTINFCPHCGQNLMFFQTAAEVGEVVSNATSR